MWLVQSALAKQTCLTLEKNFLYYQNFCVRILPLWILNLCLLLQNALQISNPDHFPHKNLFPPKLILSIPPSSVQSLSHVRLLATPWTTACQASLSITNLRSLLKPMSIESVMPSNHLILCHSLSSCLQSFPASGSFPMSQFFTSGGQSIGASSSVLRMNIQDWEPFWPWGPLQLPRLPV